MVLLKGATLTLASPKSCNKSSISSIPFVKSLWHWQTTSHTSKLFLKIKRMNAIDKTKLTGWIRIALFSNFQLVSRWAWNNVGNQKWVPCSMMTSSNGNIFRVTGPLRREFTGHRWIPPKRPVTRSFDIFFDLRLNKRLSEQSRGWWFETPPR